MSDSKKPRAMTPKGFLAKATSTSASSSAMGFLRQYREYLTTGEVAEKTSPIIAKYEAGELPASPALKEIQYAVMTHIIKAEEDKLNAPAATGGGGGTRKPWRCTVYDAAGNVMSRTNAKGEVEDLVKGFDLSQRASEWGDRRLFEGTHGWYAIVEHTTIPNISSRIERGDAVARILKQPKGPVVQVKSKSTKAIGFGVKVKESRSSFSRG
jgi:hypothetical protein